MEETLYRVLKIVCGNLNWKFAELWQLDPRTHVLDCTQVWYLRSQSLFAYEKVVTEMKCCQGEAFPSKIYDTKEPHWILTESSPFCGMSTAHAAGLNSALGCPIISDQTCVAVMVFLGSDCRNPDTGLFNLLMTVGRQIGQFIKRKQAEIQLQQRATLLQEEIAQASEYVEALLPPAIDYFPAQSNQTNQTIAPHSPLSIQRIFAPCSQLGGDSFDY